MAQPCRQSNEIEPFERRNKGTVLEGPVGRHCSGKWWRAMFATNRRSDLPVRVANA